METSIIPNKLYTEEETRELLGGIGKTKLFEYRKRGCIVPFRIRPTLYMGEEIELAKNRIMQLRREMSDWESYLSEYGIRRCTNGKGRQGT